MPNTRFPSNRRVLLWPVLLTIGIGAFLLSGRLSYGEETPKIPPVEELYSVHVNIRDALNGIEVSLAYGRGYASGEARLSARHLDKEQEIEVPLTPTQVQTFHKMLRGVVSKFSLTLPDKIRHQDPPPMGCNFSLAISTVSSSIGLGYMVQDKDHLRPAEELFFFLLQILPGKWFNEVDWLKQDGFQRQKK